MSLFFRNLFFTILQPGIVASNSLLAFGQKRKNGIDKTLRFASVFWLVRICRWIDTYVDLHRQFCHPGEGDPIACRSDKKISDVRTIQVFPQSNVCRCNHDVDRRKHLFPVVCDSRVFSFRLYRFLYFYCFL